MDLVVGCGITFMFFLAVSASTLADPVRRADLKKRTRFDWFVDVIALLEQGTLIPFIQAVLLAKLWQLFLPELKGSLRLPEIASFFLSFVVIDCVYYWNHRALHDARLWRWHRLHHSAQKMDLFMTSRNSLFTPFLIVYVWCNSLCLFLLQDTLGFVIASALGAGLDLWRHSGHRVSHESLFYRFFSPWMTFPEDHSWHHSADKSGCNYGANLIVWDRLFGTFHRTEAQPSSWGTPESSPGWRELLAPKARQGEAR